MAFDIIPDGAPVEEPQQSADIAYAGIPATAAQALGAEALSTTRSLQRVTTQGSYEGADWFSRALYAVGAYGGARPEDPLAASLEPPPPPPASIPTPMAAPEEYNKRYAPIGNDGKPVSLGDKPMPDAIAKLIGEAKREEIERNNILSRYQDAHSWPVNFATSGIGFMLDPLRAATAFIPGIGEEALLARFGSGILARGAARTIAGGATGALAMAPVAALEYGLGQEEASDYGLRQALRDVAFGAAGNAIIHAGITGPVGDILRYRRGEVQPGALNVPAPEAVPTASEIVHADAQTQHAAMSAAVAELAEGRPVDVTPIFPPPLRTPEPVEGLQFLEPVIPGARRATIAEREAAGAVHPSARVGIQENSAGGFDVETPLEGIMHAETREQAEQIAGRYRRLDPQAAEAYEQITGRNYAEDWRNNAVDAAAAARAAEVPMGRQRTTIVINGERTVIEGPTRTPADLAASQQQRYRDGFAPGVPDSELRQTAAEIYDAKLQRLATLEIENQMPEGGGTFFQRKAEEEMQAAAAPPAPARPEPVEMKVPREPTRITEFLRKSGGVQDQGGEISHVIGGKRFRPGLINGRGMTLDDAALRAWEEGYFPEMTERPTINDLLQAVQDEAQGIRRYSAKDEAAVTAYQGALAHNAEVDRLSNETGIETAGKTRSQFFDAVRDHLSVEEAARRAETLATAHEISLAAAERRAAEWAASRGDAWEADYDVGRPRTLEELEDAYRQEEAARWPRAGAGGAGAPGSATGAPRPVQAGAGPGERGIGTGRLAEPATELTDQGEQLIFPGAERSARQAAQARETTGRGMMRGATPQEEAGGLFALPKEAQEELFAAQQRLSEIESGLSAEEREQIAVAQAALPEAEAKAQAIAEAALCLKDTGL